MTLKPWLPAIELALLWLCLYLSLRNARRQMLVEMLPSSKTSGIFIGLVEVKGTAESEPPLTSYLADLPCVYYTFTVRERWTRRVTESYTDSNGSSQIRTVNKTDWDTVASGGVTTAPFYLHDEYGAVLVRPEGAEVVTPHVFSTACGPTDPLYFGKGPGGEVSGSDHIRQFVEHAIEVHTPIYVLGRARQREDIVAAEIAAAEDTPIFLITTESEDKVRHGFGEGTRIWGQIGFFLVVLYAVFGIDEHDGKREIIIDPRISLESIAWYCSAYLLAWTAGWVLITYNTMIELRHRVRQAWANVDVQLKRRADLVPNLVHVVTAGGDYEGALQSGLALLREQARATAPGRLGPDPAALSGTVRALAEAYPDLKVNGSFLGLQKALSDTEDRIELARTYFNEIATFYNTRLQQFPEGWIGRIGFLRPQALMQGHFEAAPD